MRVLAAQECRKDSIEEPADFALKYGHGVQALQRCRNHKLAKARAESREDPLEYRQDYGTGARALRRCVRDELT